MYCVAVSPNGELAASGGGDDKAFLWVLQTGEQVGELGGHKDTVTHVAFSSDGSMLATGAMDGEIRCVWGRERLQGIIFTGRCPWSGKGPCSGRSRIPDHLIIVPH